MAESKALDSEDILVSGTHHIIMLHKFCKLIVAWAELEELHLNTNWMIWACVTSFFHLGGRLMEHMKK